MTDTRTHLADAVIAAKEHGQNSWYVFTGQKGYSAIVPDWRVGRTEDGTPRLSVQVVGPGAVNALARFARDFHLKLPHPGDVRPQFDVHQPGRTVLVWRYDGVWVEFWHPDSVVDAPEVPEPVLSAPVPSPAAAPDPIPAAVRRAFLRRPGGRLPFTRKRTTNPKECSA